MEDSTDVIHILLVKALRKLSAKICDIVGARLKRMALRVVVRVSLTGLNLLNRLSIKLFVIMVDS